MYKFCRSETGIYSEVNILIHMLPGLESTTPSIQCACLIRIWVALRVISCGRKNYIVRVRIKE